MESVFLIDTCASLIVCGPAAGFVSGFLSAPPQPASAMVAISSPLTNNVLTVFILVFPPLLTLLPFFTSALFQDRAGIGRSDQFGVTGQVTGFYFGFRTDPGGFAFRQFGVVQLDFQFPAGNIQQNLVAVLQ